MVDVVAQALLTWTRLLYRWSAQPRQARRMAKEFPVGFMEKLQSRWYQVVADQVLMVRKQGVDGRNRGGFEAFPWRRNQQRSLTPRRSSGNRLFGRCGSFGTQRQLSL